MCLTIAPALLWICTLSALQATLGDLQGMYQRMEAHGWECPNRGEMMSYKLLVTRDVSEAHSEKCAPASSSASASAAVHKIES